jgi:SH3 domain-containing protein 19
MWSNNEFVLRLAQVNEKVYLLKQMNDEWLYGRNKRGCEGIFPISYVDIKVPLKDWIEPGA